MSEEYKPEGYGEFVTDLEATHGGTATGAAVLDDLLDLICRYCVLPSAHHAVAVTLWVATTHCIAAFDYATRLVIRSAEKRSGKSRLVEIIDGTCHNPLRAVNASTAAVYRSLGGDVPPTLLLDEADSQFGSKKVAENNEDLRGVLNAGYQRGLPVLKTVGPTHDPKEFETFAMVALAGIGRMPDTIEDRAIVVPMRRRKPSESVQPFRLRRDKPGLEEMRERLAEWAGPKIERLEAADPDLPVEDRQADTWAPLVAVADVAGGDWGERARRAALELCDWADAEATEQSANVQLLADIRAVFVVPFMPSFELCAALCRIEDSPWREWELNPSKLGHRLRRYDIRTAHDSDGKKRGYRLEDFRDAFDRYLPPVSPKASEGAEGVRNGAAPGEDLTPSTPSDAFVGSRGSDLMCSVCGTTEDVIPWGAPYFAARCRRHNPLMVSVS